MDKRVFVEQILKYSGIDNNYTATISRIANIIINAVDSGENIQLTRLNYDSSYALKVNSNSIDITLIDREDIDQLIEGEHYNIEDTCIFNRFIHYSDINIFMLPNHNSLECIKNDNLEFQEIVLSYLDNNKYMIKCRSFKTGHELQFIYDFYIGDFVNYDFCNVYDSVYDFVEHNCTGNKELLTTKGEVSISNNVSKLAQSVEQTSQIYGIDSINPTDVTIKRYGHIFTFLFKNSITSKIFKIMYSVASDCWVEVECVNSNSLLMSIILDVGLGSMLEWQYDDIADNLVNGGIIRIPRYGTLLSSGKVYRVNNSVVESTITSDRVKSGTECIHLSNTISLLPKDKHNLITSLSTTQLVIHWKNKIYTITFISSITNRIERLDIEGDL